MTSTHSIPVLLLVLLGVAGCGQSGPLYLPGNPSEVESPPAASPAENGDADDEDDDDDDADNDDG